MESTLQLNNETFFVVYLRQGEHFYIQRTTEQYPHNWPQKFLIAVIVAMQFTLHAFVPKNENIGSIAIRVIKTLQLTIQACIIRHVYKRWLWLLNTACFCAANFHGKQFLHMHGLIILDTPISVYAFCHYQHHSVELQTKITIVSCMYNFITKLPMSHESCPIASWSVGINIPINNKVTIQTCKNKTIYQNN